MAKPVDLELKKAFADVQRKMLDTSQKLKAADVQINRLQTLKTGKEKLSDELSSLNEGTKVYETVGRAFLLSSIPKVTNDIHTHVDAVDARIKSLQNNKQFLEQNLSDSERNLREMVKQRQAKPNDN